MIGSLLAVLLMSAQPAPAEEPAVEVQAEVQTEVEADAQTETPAAEAAVAAEAEAEVAAAEPEEEIICRRRLVPSARIGQRNRIVRDCRPASEWESTRRRR